MNPTNDPVGCATGAVLTTAPTVYTGYIQFGCINGNGEAGELTYGQLTAAITAAQAVGSNHIDITWGASMQLKQLYIYPIQAIQQYCLEWLAMGPSSTSCDPMQDCGQIIGTPFSIGAFNTVHGFLGNHCAANDFIRAWGTNTACVTDVSCLNGPTLSGIRLRIRVDCISGILAAITSANPGFFQSSTPVFAFAGLYCPNF